MSIFESSRRGIIVGCSIQIEYLLPYFYLNLRLNTDLPIVFFDFGMSAFGKDFCLKRGQVITIHESLWEAQDLSQQEMIKSHWFKKPYAFLHSPFDETLWLDIDCKIIKPIEALFEALKGDKWMGIWYEKRIIKNMKLYNSGVVVFKKQNPIIKEWIEVSKNTAHQYVGDQDTLSVVINRYLSKVSLIDKKYNYFYYDGKNFFDPSASIIHYVSAYKALLQKELLLIENSGLDTLFQTPCVDSSTTGIVVGLNATQEYLLPFFYLNLRLHCSWPIVFFDFGMTALGREFCEKRGQVYILNDTLHNPIDDSVEESIKSMWFKKPLACALAPFDINVWIDLDCMLRAPLTEIVYPMRLHHLIGITKEYSVDFSKEFPQYKNLTVYNSGFFIFKRNNPIIEEWVELSKKHHHDPYGDQDVLSFVLYNYEDKIEVLDPHYNFIVDKVSLEKKHEIDPKNPLKLTKALLHTQMRAENAKVLHFAGNTKILALSKLQALEALFEDKLLNT